MEEEMKHEWKRRIGRAVGETVVLGAGLAMGGIVSGQAAQQRGGMDTAATNVQGKFYCNIKALTTEERERHHALTEKLIASRSTTVETAKGYELQYSPEKISVAEVAQWVVTESKCCPFFDFHIDLEEQGKLICLRLTGSEGVKAFIRSEFHI
jgi:hypothetical protein